jgi:uncharacterized membrane protein YdjX (TVP38/TMEM64 family)
MTRVRTAVLLALALSVTAFFALGLNRYVSLEYFQASQTALATRYAQAPWQMRGAFFVLYVAVTALSLPGAAVLTLAGGAVLGFGWCLLLVSFASSIGATVSFLVARCVLRDSVQRRFGNHLSHINRGLERDGALYLLSLRLIPVVPFFLINLCLGLTRMRTWTFYGVSQVGMLPGTAVYVNAGTELTHIHSVGDVATPGVLVALVLLGVFPLLAGLRRLHARRRG